MKLRRNMTFVLVPILGLGVGLAVCLLLLGYARYCWQYDAHVPESEHVYVVKHRNNLALGEPWYTAAPLLLREVARNTPGVANASGYLGWFRLTVKVDGELRPLKSLTVLPGFAEVTGLKPVVGDLREALTRPDNFAITEAAAMRLFGTTNVLGKTVELRLDAIDQNTSIARIAAVLPSPPANTTIQYETLSGATLSLMPQFMRNEALSGEMGWAGNLLVRLHPGASRDAVNKALQDAVDSAPALQQRVPPEMKVRLGGRKLMDIQLSPLHEAYFDREVKVDWAAPEADRGDARVVAALVAVALLILALAAINYVNLATIQVMRRQREIAVRKVLGASQKRLVLQLIAESLRVSLLATALGVLLAALALPLFAELMNRDLASVLSFENIGAACVIGLLLGLLTAVYPAWIALGVRPTQLLAGRPATESRQSMRLRRALSVVQVAVAMGLAGFTLAIAWQTRFAIDASPGFDPSPLLVFELPVGEQASSPRSRGLIAAISQAPAVAGVAVSMDPIGRTRYPWSTEIKREGGEAVTLEVKSINTSFFEMYGIRPLAGRLFDPRIDKEEDAAPIVLNGAAAHQLGFASPQLAVGQSLLFRNAGARELSTKRIIGIAPEIRFQSLRESPGAMAYEVSLSGMTLTVRMNGSRAEAGQAVRAAWPQYFPNSFLDLRSAKEIYAANYADDARLAGLLALSTAIALLIAAFGVYVLAADAVQRRTGEIALRKLFGARRLDVGKVVAREIGTTVLISAVIALPVSALAIARYLAPYTEQTPLAFWGLVFALVAVSLTAALSTARQTWLAMMLKPALALRG